MGSCRGKVIGVHKSDFSRQHGRSKAQPGNRRQAYVVAASEFHEGGALWPPLPSFRLLHGIELRWTAHVLSACPCPAAPFRRAGADQISATSATSPRTNDRHHHFGTQMLSGAPHHQGIFTSSRWKELTVEQVRYDIERQDECTKYHYPGRNSRLMKIDTR
jgi:hypothetical protein